MVIKAKQKWWWQLTLNAISQVLLKHLMLCILWYNINSPSGKAKMAEREMEKVSWLQPQVAITLTNKNSSQHYFLHAASGAQVCICVENCYNAHTLCLLSPSNAERYKAKQSSFVFVFLWQKMSCWRMGTVLCRLFCRRLLWHKTKMCWVMGDGHLSSFAWAAQIGFSYYVQKEFCG